MATTTKKQDMPPPGGFRPINYERVKARTYFSGPTLFLGFFGITAGAVYLYVQDYRKMIKRQIEKRSALLAITPVMFAERDRAFLKQLRVNRDLEADLMKNVEGWEVGTLYGEPIYKTRDPDFLIEPRIREYYIHNSWRDASTRVDARLWA